MTSRTTSRKDRLHCAAERGAKPPAEPRAGAAFGRRMRGASTAGITSIERKAGKGSCEKRKRRRGEVSPRSSALSAPKRRQRRPQGTERSSSSSAGANYAATGATPTRGRHMLCVHHRRTFCLRVVRKGALSASNLSPRVRSHLRPIMGTATESMKKWMKILQMHPGGSVTLTSGIESKRRGSLRRKNRTMRRWSPSWRRIQIMGETIRCHRLQIAAVNLHVSGPRKSGGKRMTRWETSWSVIGGSERGRRHGEERGGKGTIGESRRSWCGEWQRSADRPATQRPNIQNERRRKLSARPSEERRECLVDARLSQMLPSGKKASEAAMVGARAAMQTVPKSSTRFRARWTTFDLRLQGIMRQPPTLRRMLISEGLRPRAPPREHLPRIERTVHAPLAHLVHQIEREAASDAP